MASIEKLRALRDHCRSITGADCPGNCMECTPLSDVKFHEVPPSTFTEADMKHLAEEDWDDEN